jgi:hypothetical protein
MKPTLMTWEDIHHVAAKVCKKFKLPWPVTFEPLKRTARRCSRMYGEYEYDHCPTCKCPPIIRLRLKGRRPLSRAAIMAVLAHELAHLRERRHAKKHEALTREIAAWMTEQGYPVTAHMLVIPPKKGRKT